jgi:mannose-6-phosphate isomerase-like protein (cupin superfamily)
MSDLEHTRGQFPSLALVLADLRRDGFRPVPYLQVDAGEVDTHSHPIDETVYPLYGSMTFTIAGKTYALRPGDKLRLPTGTPHSVSLDAGTLYISGWSEMVT